MQEVRLERYKLEMPAVAGLKVINEIDVPVNLLARSKLHEAGDWK